MESYKEEEILYLNNINPNIIYGNLSKELKLWFYFQKEEHEDNNIPIKIWAIGKTFPNPDYFIKRSNYHSYVIEYVSDGIGYIEINNKKIKVEKGDVYILKKGGEHYYYPDKDNPYTKYWINFYSEIFDAMFESSPLKDVVKIPGVFCEDLFIELLNVASTSPYHRVVCYDVFEKLLKIFAKLVKHTSKANSQRIPANIRKIKNMLDQSVFSNISIEDICKKVSLSNSYVISQFKEYYGITPHQYLIDCKIKQATILLHDQSINMSEIANRLGFYDSYHFSKIFKQKLGVSPRIYRSKTY